MNISLTPILKQFVNEKVSSGMYVSASEVVREALRIMMAQEKTVSPVEIEQLQEDIDDGLGDNIICDGLYAMKTFLSEYE